MTGGELKLFLKILPALAQHHRKCPNSILAKIFGVFTVKMRGVESVHIMLMENTLRLKDPDRLNYIFDLKGSTVDRMVKGVTKTSTTLKDVNFLMAAQQNKCLTKQIESNLSLLKSAISYGRWLNTFWSSISFPALLVLLFLNSAATLCH